MFRFESDEVKAVASFTKHRIAANALSDPDNPPLAEERLATLRPAPRVMKIRYALKLSREGFATRFGIPLETLLSWERGLAEPDETAQAFLCVIEREPEAVARALARPAAP